VVEELPVLISGAEAHTRAVRVGLPGTCEQVVVGEDERQAGIHEVAGGGGHGQGDKRRQSGHSDARVHGSLSTGGPEMSVTLRAHLLDAALSRKSWVYWQVLTGCGHSRPGPG